MKAPTIQSPIQSHLLLMPDVPSSDLSLEEIGVLSQMLNMAECDYLTPDELAKHSSDSPRKTAAILNSLVEKEFVSRSGDVYFVNKFRIPEMQVHQIPTQRVIRFTDTVDGEEV